MSEQTKVIPLLTLSQAAELVPAGTYQKLRRWALDGATVRGETIKLRTVMSGPCRYTSAEWVKEFQDAIDKAAEAGSSVA